MIFFFALKRECDDTLDNNEMPPWNNINTQIVKIQISALIGPRINDAHSIINRTNTYKRRNKYTLCLISLFGFDGALKWHILFKKNVS